MKSNASGYDLNDNKYSCYVCSNCSYNHSNMLPNFTSTREARFDQTLAKNSKKIRSLYAMSAEETGLRVKKIVLRY